MTERDENDTPADPDLETAESAPRRRGSIRQQDENTAPREPTLAERRARERAERRRREQEEQRVADEAAGRKKRKRIFVGAGVTVGVVALIAVGYAAAQPDDEIEAHCVDDSGVVVDDSNCAVPAENTTATGGGGGFAFFPIFLGAGGRQYHYNYGGTGTIGQPVAGGTNTVPKDGTPVRTSSGSSTVTRGGLGVSKSTSGSSVGGSSSGGSKSGGSVGSSSGGSKSGGS
jgi:hypothetical protein